MSALVEVSHLVKHFTRDAGVFRAGTRVTAVDDVSFAIEEGETFGYREPENTRFDVSEASRWMLSFLHAGEPGQTLTLRDMMNPEYQLFDDTMVTDDCGNEYPHGSNTYAWGFEVCLWHHARSKHIEPLFDDETQREAWEEHLRHQHLPPRPDSSADRALWHVPFRLVEGVDPDHAQHVGASPTGLPARVM